MEKWVGRGCYRRLDFLQRDLLSVLTSAAAQSKTVSLPLTHSHIVTHIPTYTHTHTHTHTHTQMNQKAVAVGRVYLQARDQAVVGGKTGTLESPALAYTAANLERDLAEQLTLSSSSLSDEGAEPVAKAIPEVKGGDGEIKMVEDGDLVDELTVAEESYRTGDTVYLSARCVWRSCDVHVSVM